VVSSRQQADGSRQYLTQMFFLSVLLLPAAYLSRDSVLTAGKNPFPEAKGFALKQTRVAFIFRLFIPC
jgi:hypothetical protein